MKRKRIKKVVFSSDIPSWYEGKIRTIVRKSKSEIAREKLNMLFA